MNKLNRSFLTELLVKNAIVCTLYTCISLFLAPLSFGPIQFRISEILALLPFINPYLCPGLILGCFLTNIFSPFGIIDALVGTFATACAVYCISKTKNLFMATLFPTIFCVFIGLMISIMSNIPFIPTTLSIMAGEFVAVTLIGYPVFRKILKNQRLVAFIKCQQGEIVN